MLIPYQIKNAVKWIEALADTHGRHREYQYYSEIADILVCAGDVCDGGDEAQLCDFFDWFASQPAKHKLFVPGNHDLPFDLDPEYAVRYVPRSVTFIDNGGVTLGGVRFYALPVRPWLHEPLYLPQRVDVLVTHGAPSGILDCNGKVGCAILRDIVNEAKPRVHIFGHCHQEGTKKVETENTDFYNVAVKIFG